MERGERGELGATGSPPDHSLATRLAWITGLRLAFLALLLGATTTLYLRGDLARYPFSLDVVFVTIAPGFALAAVVCGGPARGQAPAGARVGADRARPAHVDRHRLRDGRRHERRDLVLRAHLPRSARSSSGCAEPRWPPASASPSTRRLCAGSTSAGCIPPLDQAEGAYALDARRRSSTRCSSTRSA